ncbi:MAG TPA: ABC transporter ATP-binding protein [Lachnospiraceae bacterium]|nr:ABC transporter ATP-binding protein [Lachnospiraceae bacterium]
MTKAIIRMENVCKDYGENRVVKSLNMDVFEGEFLTMLGPSGCGKTTTLRMLAGFEKPTAGNIYVEDKEIQEVEPYHREVNTVFQNYALFPHMTVYENIAFGLQIKKVSKTEIRKKVEEMLELVQLIGYENRKPSQLSGGQKQRVAIARALINQPKVLLLDEPLGALDLKLRKQMQFELKRLQKKLGITFIYVTHDQEEALTMSDRIAILSEGVLEQLGRPRDIYNKPASKFVADFIGESNLFYGTVKSRQGNKIEVTLETGSVSADCETAGIGDIVDISVRPENLKMSVTPVEGFHCPGVVKEYVFIGNIHKVVVLLASGKELRINQSPKVAELPAGTAVNLYWDSEDAVVIPSADNQVFQAVENPRRD